MNRIKTAILKNRFIIILLFLFSSLTFGFSQSTSWPETNTEMLPGTRWWWLGSAVNKTNLTYNLEQYGHAGIGTVEITPIYGVQNNEANDIQFLSPLWMQMLQFTMDETKRLGMQTDMNTGTGWPFGGPEVTLDDAASRLLIKQFHFKGNEIFSSKIVPNEKNQQGKAKLSRLVAFNSENQYVDLSNKIDANDSISWKVPQGDWTLIAAFCGKTFQKVKRAAPGGEGYVMDHFSKTAVNHYLNRFDKAFEKSHNTFPHNFFNDSYEVYEADWTFDFFDQFYQRRGYKLEYHLPAFLSSVRTDETARLVSDYRQTISDLLLENFTQQWTNWAHGHGSKTRNQAHGSPGNLIDLYATVDVPECEGFGLSDFHINGLRKDSLVRKNDSEISMMKYASSAAHISGKTYTSSETFTWLTEHFRTSLSQCKPDLDLLFSAGVNHCYFQGTPYSPKEAAWPGWQFYASVNISPTNSLWHDAPAMFSYITRCQSFLQMGKPDNDFLVYLPIWDVWHDQPGRLLQMDIHQMSKRMPHFISVIQSIYQSGYDVDYISDKFILSTTFKNGFLVTSGGTPYKALVLPAVHKIPVEVLKHISMLIEQGAKVVFIDNFPDDVPGYRELKKRRSDLYATLKYLNKNVDFATTLVNSFGKGEIITGSDYVNTLKTVGYEPEDMKLKLGLHILRRSNADGYHYFISNLQHPDVNGWANLAVPARSALLFDPLNGKIGKAKLRIVNGKTQVYLQLKSGVSLILKTFSNKNVEAKNWEYLSAPQQVITLNSNWKLHFKESIPQIDSVFSLKSLGTWTDLDLPDLKINRGTGIYETTFNINKLDSNAWILHLGDVRESARVIVNNQPVNTLWSVPFEYDIRNLLHIGVNSLRIEVTNLPANAIADLDRRHVKWRIFKEINFVDLNYKTTHYGSWQVMPSGLLGPVEIFVQPKF
jgi:hypothetical protein